MTRFIAAASAAALMALPAFAQSDMDMTDADAAAKEMMGASEGVSGSTYRTPSQVIERLHEIGYTDIDDFDVEWGQYEVEATSPGGDDVELEIDARTGTILDVDDDWF
jgi:uncharacterized membrane protein YkoI